jgi:DNA mismatch repair protein MutL
MNVIRQLPPVVQNRIAAGEVVERPAAVAKELVENALDAGATAIEIIVAGSGVELIRVTDNGEGMRLDDLQLCVERHATSKLNTDDLLDIHTFGFRGEALPSIGAVARLDITTRHRSEPHGWNLSVENGIKNNARPAAFERGTMVEVRELFHSVPARLKFLKSERAELAAISDSIEKLALANPHVQFRLNLNNRSARHFQVVENAKARIEAILGSSLIDGALRIEAQSESLRIKGFIGRPSQYQPTTRMQFFFVNGRPVRDRLLIGTLRAAYGDSLRRDRFPFAVLFIEVPVQEVDVNVHPAKTEIRFRDAMAVRSLLSRAVREALLSAGFSPVESKLPDYFTAPQNSAHSPSQTESSFEGIQKGFDDFSAPVARDHQNSKIEVSYPLGAARAQLHETYILSETPGGLILIDQHAAHERIVYEKLKRAYEAKAIPRQILLVPDIINLSPSQCEALLSHNDDLERWGFVIESFGPDTVIVREVPSMLGLGDTGQLLRALADEILSFDGSTKAQDHLWSIASRIACHGSVRAGRVLKLEEMNALLREMETTPLASTCNHGRPTYIHLAKDDLERLFNRR